MQPTQLERKKIFYLLLPVLVIPCLTLFFYALGGGKGENTPTTQTKGLNPLLPEAQLISAPGDKMSLYAQALKDSMGLGDLRKSDPYIQDTSAAGDNSTMISTGKTGVSYTDPNESKVNDRLATLQRTLNQNQGYGNRPDSYESIENQQLKRQLLEVQQQMHQMTSNGLSQPDPQIEQINTVLNKIMEVQHPEIVKDRLEQESLKNKGQVYPIVEVGQDILTNPIVSKENNAPIGFYGLTENVDTAFVNSTAVAAEVQESQTLTSGATVKLRLSSDILIAGQSIEKGSLVYGNCTLSGERLKISVSSIRSGDRILPTSLTVYDMDGQEGIRIPDAISRDATKEGTDQALQSMNLMALDPGIGAQAASAAVQTAKSLFTRKIKLVKATVRAGYQVLLVDKSRQNRQ
ncbi:conjugative transposon protein TraM [Rhizosphaericola mali]|nr:conjugative transposon protein TraM [Rhizosphaericola mali]